MMKWSVRHRLLQSRKVELWQSVVFGYRKSNGSHQNTYMAAGAGLCGVVGRFISPCVRDGVERFYSALLIWDSRADDTQQHTQSILFRCRHWTAGLLAAFVVLLG